MKLLTTIYSKESSRYTYAANVFVGDTLLNGKSSVCWFGDMDNDVDGSPYWHQDPYGQADTSLHYEGKPLNGDKIPFIVVQDTLIKLVPDIVLGCQGMIEWRGQRLSVVVGDTGPHSKLGEGSPAALRGIGAPAPHDGNGGIDLQEVFYCIWPGVPARLVIEGIPYNFDLKPSR